MVEENFGTKSFCFNTRYGITSLTGSVVNTDDKKEAKTSAFFLSVVADNLMLFSKIVRSHIPDIVMFF